MWLRSSCLAALGAVHGSINNRSSTGADVCRHPHACVAVAARAQPAKLSTQHSCARLPVQPIAFSVQDRHKSRPQRPVITRATLDAPETEASPSPQHSQEQCENEQEECGDGQDDVGLQELSTARHIITVDHFAPELTKKLRAVFDEQFADPRTIHEHRFHWDYWYCPDAVGTCQYNLVRTQAQVYFPGELYSQLVDALLEYGETNLGCRSISPIWMSYYVDGMMQNLHCDNPHGPFAFVLSLTNWEGREFTGGETGILRPQTLSYWSRPDPSKGMEHCDLVELVPPLFGRLTVFDPRFPHEVRQVHGTRDPRNGRLVLHGWFTSPSPFIQGGLSADEVAQPLDEALSGAIESLQEPDEGLDGEEVPSLGSHPCRGMLAVRLQVDGITGKVRDVKFLADTLVPLPAVEANPMQVRALIQHELHAWLSDASFPVAQDKADTYITVPVMFD